jgi:hypothetical protein
MKPFPLFPLNALLYFSFILSSLLLACGSTSDNGNDNPQQQSLHISVDEKPYTFSSADIITLNYVSNTHLVFSALSEKQNLSFSFSAYLTELKPGTFHVYTCHTPSECSSVESDQNQHVILAPYPTNPLPPVQLSRMAYNAPSLSLLPLTLTITSVTKEQQPGVPYSTNRVKGTFSGILAYGEVQDNGTWIIVGKSTSLEGTFDLLCATI